jgi:hypothetical protein
MFVHVATIHFVLGTTVYGIMFELATVFLLLLELINSCSSAQISLLEYSIAIRTLSIMRYVHVLVAKGSAVKAESPT